jgi:hypothetical protein
MNYEDTALLMRHSLGWVGGAMVRFTCGLALKHHHSLTYLCIRVRAHNFTNFFEKTVSYSSSRLLLILTLPGILR